MLQAQRTLLVISADLSHYLPYTTAVKRDRETLDRILALDPNWQQDQDNRTCGRYPVGVLLELARREHWRPVLLHYRNSGDSAGEKTTPSWDMAPLPSMERNLCKTKPTTVNR